MGFQWKNGRVQLDGAAMDYIRFGTGSKILVMLPGLGDGLKTVKGTALPMALMYREFAGPCTVYAFSRREPLPEGFTTEAMAQDLAEAMDRLGIDSAAVLGVSMGGMIAQYLAIAHPEKVERLVLAVTAARSNPVLVESVGEWTRCAQQGDHTGFMDSNVRRIYSEGYYRRNRWLVPVMGRLTKPASYERFYIQAKACLGHDTYDRLVRIRAATLVIGGERDQALGGDASREIAGAIPGAQLKMYEQWGHGLYEEAGDFNRTVLDFIQAT